MPSRLAKSKPLSLTKSNLSKLEDDFAKDVQSGKTDRIFLDDQLTGFGLRFRAGGKRTWVLQYKRGADRHG